MMRTLRIGYPNLVRQLLPAHKRQPVRQWWLKQLLAPLAELFCLFDRWRDDTRMLVNVTSQVKVLEGYLRKKYAEPIAIRIETYEDGGLPVCLEEEGQTQRLDLARDESEGLPTASVPFEGEIREQFAGMDFRVLIPDSVDTDSVRADIERFRQALSRYEIIKK